MAESLVFILQAFIISLVAGITEFLPISSTGHMILVGHFIGFTGSFAKLFEIVIQLGAILAIVVLYRKKILGTFKKMRPGEEGFEFWSKIALGFLPFGMVAFLFSDIVKQYLMYPIPVAIALLVGAGLMLAAEKKFRSGGVIDDVFKVNRQRAVIIGLFQCLALWPGFSRSAATIIGGWTVGLTTVAAAEFSFFLAIPTMLIASVYTLASTDLQLSVIEWFTLAGGFITAFVSALFVVERFILFLKKRPMKGFAYYRIVIGAIILALALFGIL